MSHKVRCAAIFRVDVLLLLFEVEEDAAGADVCLAATTPATPTVPLVVLEELEEDDDASKLVEIVDSLVVLGGKAEDIDAVVGVLVVIAEEVLSEDIGALWCPSACRRPGCSEDPVVAALLAVAFTTRTRPPPEIKALSVV